MKAIKPYRDKILISVDEPECITESGIIIPDEVQKKPVKGLIIAIGDEVKCVKKGDHVLFSKWAGIELNEGLLVNESDIIGVFDG